MDDLDLLEKLSEETREIASLLYAYNTDATDMGEEQFRLELQNECGDVINVLRFIADKYGAI